MAPRTSKAKGNKFDALKDIPAEPVAVPDKVIPASRKEIKDLSVDALLPGPFQYRKYFDPKKIDELAEIFKSRGMHGVIWVEPAVEAGKYLIISGERSWRAAQQAGIELVSCEVIRDLTDIERAELGYLANDAPVRLNMLEDTQALLDILSLNLRLTSEDTKSLLYLLNNSLTRKKPLSQHALTQLESVEATMERIKGNREGWRHFIKNRIPMLSLPEELLQAIDEGSLDGTSAIAIGKLDKAKQRVQMIERTIEENLSSREVQQAVRDLLPKTRQPAGFKQYKALSRKLQVGLKHKEIAPKLKNLISQIEDVLKELDTDSDD